MTEYHSPTKQHNFVRKMQEIYNLAGSMRGSVTFADVVHDDWCDLLNKRGYCNCDPIVEEITHEKPKRR